LAIDNKLPVVTNARDELMNSLEKGEDDVKAGRHRRIAFSQLSVEMSADFERITGYTIPQG
jgi:hypothetical protein